MSDDLLKRLRAGVVLHSPDYIARACAAMAEAADEIERLEEALASEKERVWGNDRTGSDAAAIERKDARIVRLLEKIDTMEAEIERLRDSSQRGWVESERLADELAIVTNGYKIAHDEVGHRGKEIERLKELLAKNMEAEFTKGLSDV